MTEHTATPLDWFHDTAGIPEDGIEVDREATEGERRALAAALGLVSCERLRARYRLRPGPGESIGAKGTILADITQTCVATLEPMANHISEPFEVEFRQSLPEPPRSGEEHSVLDLPDIEPIEDGRISIGRVLSEILASALDPYPRKGGETADWRDPEQPGASPFAALERLKR